MSNHEQYAGYLFVYFTDDEGQGGGEEIYFSLSQGNDPLHWRELNGGKPVLTSKLGEKGVRDPFIIRSPQGDKFFLLGTDLKAHGGWRGLESRRQRRQPIHPDVGIAGSDPLVRAEEG